MNSIKVIGAGLIGTSIALGAKRAGLTVELLDADLRAANLANDLVFSEPVDDPDLVVIATPSSALRGILEEFRNQYVNCTFIDIGSTKTKVAVDIQSFPELVNRFCPTHPMAGRELNGAEAAQSDLFSGRTWVVTPLEETGDLAVQRAKELIVLLGATSVQMSVEEHDAAVATVSHLPQIISSLLATQFLDKPTAYLELAGGGAFDTTRIAASKSELWNEILNLNKNALLPLLKDFQSDLSKLIDNFDVEQVLRNGREGRLKLPGKHRGQNRNYVYLPVVIEDKPGQLAKLFDECAAAKVNVEDLAIEHSPEQETGLIILALNDVDAQKFYDYLQNRGWRVHPPRSEK